MQKLNFKQVEMLWTVVTAGSISAAARQLDVSQPAISRMLSQTEAQVGVRFFERIRGRLRPTKELSDLLPDIEKAHLALQRVNDMTLAISDSRGGVLKVASNPSLGKHVMPQALTAFRQAYPGTFLRFHTVTIQEIVPELLSGEVDLAVLTIPAEHPFLTSVTLATGYMTAIVPLDHPLAGHLSVSLEELAAFPHVLVGERLHFGMIVLGAFSRAGLQPKIVADVPWCDLACALVNEGMGCAIVDQFSVRSGEWSGMKAIPLSDPIPIRMHAVMAVNRPVSDVARRFLRVLKGMYKDH